MGLAIGAAERQLRAWAAVGSVTVVIVGEFEEHTADRAHQALGDCIRLR